MQPELEILAIAILTAATCAVAGVFLILRQMAMMSDAISHAILPGIVIFFFLTHDLNSPWLLVGATLAGILTVWFVEFIYRGGQLREDAAIGLVFPFFFSIGVILISRYASNIHLDLDAVLLGELAFAPFDRFVVAGVDLGARGIYVMLAMLVVNLSFLLLFYKELKVSTFDPGMAAVLGLLPVVVHYGFMSLISLTIVTAFDIVGAILVIALFIAPPAAAYLLTDRLNVMVVLSLVLAIASATSGYLLAHFFDVSIAGSMATMAGVAFLLSFFFAPEHGQVTKWRLQDVKRKRFDLQMLTIHLLQHETEQEDQHECELAHLHEHLSWSTTKVDDVSKRAQRTGLLTIAGDKLYLTPQGRSFAQETLVKM